MARGFDGGEWSEEWTEERKERDGSAMGQGKWWKIRWWWWKGAKKKNQISIKEF